MEVGGEGDAEVLELLAETRVEVRLGLLGVVDGGRVAVVEEVTGRDEAVAAVVAGPAGEEDAVSAGEGLEFEDCGGLVGCGWRGGVGWDLVMRWGKRRVGRGSGLGREEKYRLGKRRVQRAP